MGVGAGAGVLVTKKIERSPAIQARINAGVARAGGAVSDIKEKVHPTKPAGAPTKADIMKLIKTLPPEQQELAMAFVSQVQS